MKYLGLLLIVALLAACHKEPEASPQLSARMEAANSISDLNARNESVGKVAVDAANAKDIKVTTKAIESISDPNLKNSTAETCALALSKKAEPKAAAAIAQLISDPNIRNRTLQVIAQGQ